MQVSPQTQPSEPKIKLRTYVSIGKDLYYIIDVNNDENLYLVENCKTLDLRWFDSMTLYAAKEVKRS